MRGVHSGPIPGDFCSAELPRDGELQISGKQKPRSPFIAGQRQVEIQFAFLFRMHYDDPCRFAFNYDRACSNSILEADSLEPRLLDLYPSMHTVQDA